MKQTRRIWGLCSLAISLLMIGCGGGSEPTPTATDAPQALINSPASGSKTAGTIVFSVQPFDVSEVASVRFSVAGNEVDVDTTAEDGFRIFLDTRDYPDGELELGTVTTGNSGKATTEIITVENFNNPPSTATVDRDGAVLGTLDENGVLSTLVVPAGINEGATVSLTARTQDQVLEDTGIDYDAAGMTFLGAQQIDSDQALQQTLIVSSGGFESQAQVQPDQAMLNFNILPDADGDGIGELVVANTASIAPNGDVISDPVAQIQTGSTAKVLSATRSNKVLARKIDNLSAEPGMFIELEATALNIYSRNGNYAFFYSPATNSYSVSLGSVFPHPTDTDKKIFRAAVPNLPAGPAKLAVVNLGSGQVSELMDFEILPLSALRGSSAKAVYDDYIDRIKSSLIDVPLAEREKILAKYDEVQLALDEVYGLLEESGNTEALLALEMGARMLENVPIESISAKVDTTILGCPFPADAAIGLMLSAASLLWPPIGVAVSAVDIAFNIYTQVRENQANIESGIAINADFVQGVVAALQVNVDDALKLQLKSFGRALSIAGFAYNLYIYRGAIAEYAKCQKALVAAVVATFKMVNSFVQTGQSGGAAAGDVEMFVDAVISQALAFKQGEPLAGGRFIVKILVGGVPERFTGVTDASGYFYIPMIPADRNFVAIATDTQTGEQRTIEGVGPPINESIYLPFDFTEPDTGGPNPISLNQVIAGTIETANETDFYSFTAAAGQEVFFNTEYIPASVLQFDVFDSDGTRVFDSLLGTVGSAGRRVLTKGGVYTIAVSVGLFGQPGQYSFDVNDVIRQTFEISINDTVTTGVPDPGAGEIESIGDIDVYTFTADPGQEVFFDVQGFGDLITANFVVTDSDGTVVLDGSLLPTDPGSVLLNKGGTYTLTIGGNINRTGPYSFQIRAGTQ